MSENPKRRSGKIQTSYKRIKVRRKATPPGPRGPLPDRAVGNPLCRTPADGRRPRRGHTEVGGGRSQGAEVLSDRCAISVL